MGIVRVPCFVQAFAGHQQRAWRLGGEVSRRRRVLGWQPPWPTWSGSPGLRCVLEASVSPEMLSQDPGVVVIAAGVTSPAAGGGLRVLGGGSPRQADYQLLR